MRKKYRITWDHIDGASRDDCEECPIALATGARVGNRHLMSRRGEVFALPEDARKFVDDFDAGRDVEPFTLRLGDEL